MSEDENVVEVVELGFIEGILRRETSVIDPGDVDSLMGVIRNEAAIDPTEAFAVDVDVSDKLRNMLTTLETRTITEASEAMLQGALDWLQLNGRIIILRDSLRLFDGDVEMRLLGCCFENEIWINTLLFERNMKELNMTLIEEWCHLQCGAGDKTLEYERFLINELFRVMLLSRG